MNFYTHIHLYIDCLDQDIEYLQHNSRIPHIPTQWIPLPKLSTCPDLCFHSIVFLVFEHNTVWFLFWSSFILHYICVIKLFFCCYVVFYCMIIPYAINSDADWHLTVCSLEYLKLSLHIFWWITSAHFSWDRPECGIPGL